MTVIDAIVERASDGTFCIYSKDSIFSGAGATMEEAGNDMMRQMAFYRETAIKEGFKYPGFLDGEFRIRYSVDVTSLMKYYVGAGIFSLSGMEKVTGINQKQLWAYMNGTKPRKTQLERIERGFRSLSNDLSMMFA
ncbi:MAG: hypothetical protein J6X71_08005 [Bacteroidales bacterium]|nr:hypothetical protein [Bacteroidales bacterium]